MTTPSDPLEIMLAAEAAGDWATAQAAHDAHLAQQADAAGLDVDGEVRLARAMQIVQDPRERDEPAAVTPSGSRVVVAFWCAQCHRSDDSEPLARLYFHRDLGFAFQQVAPVGIDPAQNAARVAGLRERAGRRVGGATPRGENLALVIADDDPPVNVVCPKHGPEVVAAKAILNAVRRHARTFTIHRSNGGTC